MAAFINKDTEILNLRRKVERVGINAEGDDHLNSTWVLLKNSCKLIGRILTGLFWMTPLANETLFAYKGDTVTVFGLLKYNELLQNYEVENPLAFFLGGRGDLLTVLWKKMVYLENSIFHWCVLGAISFGIAGVLYSYSKVLKNRN